jgi:hypothetical protein
MAAPDCFLIKLFTAVARTKEVQVVDLNRAWNGIFAGLYH